MEQPIFSSFCFVYFFKNMFPSASFSYLTFLFLLFGVFYFMFLFCFIFHFLFPKFCCYLFLFFHFPYWFFSFIFSGNTSAYDYEPLNILKNRESFLMGKNILVLNILLFSMRLHFLRTPCSNVWITIIF
jgi:hypothetical protein